ncbi:hypothetical protein ACFLXE_02990 [Chloroflexota bacterium]
MAVREVFKVGTKKNTIPMVVGLVVLGYFGVTLAIWMYQAGGPDISIDFACGERISDDGCLEYYFDDPEKGPHSIEMFLSAFYYWADGGGCLSEASDNDEIAISP